MKTVYESIALKNEKINKNVHSGCTHMLLGLGTHLFVKVRRSGDNEGTFRSSSQAATCYYQYQSNQSKVEGIALPKDTTSELAGLSPH